MTHRAETILEAVRIRLTGLAVTGPRVERAYIWPVEECPALTIQKGEDRPLENGRSMGFQSRALEVVVTAYVKAVLANPETALNQIAAQVYTAMFADVTQGLAFVMDTHWQGDARPDFSPDTETRTATMRMVFQIDYRHDINNPEN